MPEPCSFCGGSHSSYSPPPFSTPCSNTPGQCTPIDSSCVTYTGQVLNCLNVTPGESQESINQKIDGLFCISSGVDWSSFDYHCLTDDTTITTPEQFVSYMTLVYCNLQSNYDTFVGTTFPNQVATLNTSINSILSPGLTLCAGSGITPSDTYTSILTKLANKVCTLSAQDVSSANWTSCFTVPTLPTTVVDGFNVVISQICQVKALASAPVTLPTFNNQGSCLANPGTADTLVDTINKIKTRVCLSPTYSIGATTWDCFTTPTDFQSVVNLLVAQANIAKKHDAVFDSNIFAVTDNGCNGRAVTLQAGFSGSDRLVASDASDSNPGTLADKLTPGTNITLDNTTSPGHIIVNAAPSLNDKVKANTSDTTAGYLVDKLQGASTDGIDLTAVANIGNTQVVLTPTLDFSVLATKFFDQVEGDPDLYARFCSLICGCQPCNTTPPVTPTVKRVRLRVVNNGVRTTANKYVFTQNSPVLGWTASVISVDAGQTYESGWYDVTSTTTTLAANVSITDANPAPFTQNLNVRVLQPSNATIPGTTSYVGVLGTGYTNTNFSLGSLTTDMTIEVQIS